MGQTTQTARNAGFSRHRGPQGREVRGAVPPHDAPARTAGLQTGTRGAPRRARRNPNRSHGARCAERNENHVSLIRAGSAPPRSAGLRPASRGSAKRALMALSHAHLTNPSRSRLAG